MKAAFGLEIPKENLEAIGFVTVMVIASFALVFIGFIAVGCLSWSLRQLRFGPFK